MQCTRCYGQVPDGSAISPCCGVHLRTDAPGYPGTVYYDQRVVDLAIEDLRTDLGKEQDQLGIEIRRLNFAKKRGKQWLLTLASTNLLTLILVVVHFHG